MNTGYTNRGQAKIRFFAVYAASVILILLVLSSFISFNASEATRALSPKTDSRIAIDDLLHRRIQPLQIATVRYIENGAKSEGMTVIERERQSVQSAVDSIRKVIADNSDAKEKAGIEDLLTAFVASVESQTRLVKSVDLVKKNIPANDQTTNGEVGQLKGLLAQKEAQLAEAENRNKLLIEEKDRTIASLRNRPAAQPSVVVQRADGAAAEWKEKYNRLKTTADQTTTQLDAMKSSYKQVVDDNRRLITQLQAARAGRN